MMKSSFKISKILLNLVLLVGCIVMISPFIWMIISASKSPAEVISMPPVLFPADWSFEKYLDVFRLRPMGRYFLNSFIYASVTTISGLFLGSMAAYGFAKHNFRFKKVMFFFIITGMMLPYYVKIIPWFIFVGGLGFTDSLEGVILPNIITIFGVFWLHQYMLGIPDELLDSARIDGASEWRIYWRIVLPQCVPALAALAIFRFMWAWDDFFWPLIVVSSDTQKTVSIGLASYAVGPWLDYALLMAAATVVITPMLIVYFILQKKFVQGVTLTGIKQ